jgi:hypothetical protein
MPKRQHDYNLAVDNSTTYAALRWAISHMTKADGSPKPGMRGHVAHLMAMLEQVHVEDGPMLHQYIDVCIYG